MHRFLIVIFLIFTLTAYAKSEEQLKKAAEQGNTKSQVLLGTLYKNQNKTRQAKKWLEKASKQGDRYAQLNLGTIYYDEKKVEEAKHWYKKAAEQGLAEAQSALGVAFYEQNKLKEAQYWWEKAVKQGNAKAQNNLAGLYMRQGKTTEAQKLLKEAASRGLQEAKTNLSKIDKNKAKSQKPLCPTKEMFGKPFEFNAYIFGYLVSLKWSDSKDAFCVVNRRQKGTYFAIDSIPQGQTLSNATEVLTISAFQNAQISNKEFLSLPQAEKCKTHTSKVVINTPNKLEVIKVCGSYEDKMLRKQVSRTNHYVLKRRGNNTYIFLYSKFDTPFNAATYEFHDAYIAEWSKILNRIRLTK